VSMRQWTLLHTLHDDMYTDYNMCRHAYHDVTLTYDSDEDKWWSITRLSAVSDGPEGQFSDERELPDAITNKLRKIMETLT